MWAWLAMAEKDGLRVPPRKNRGPHGKPVLRWQEKALAAMGWGPKARVLPSEDMVAYMSRKDAVAQAMHEQKLLPFGMFPQDFMRFIADLNLPDMSLLAEEVRADALACASVFACACV